MLSVNLYTCLPPQSSNQWMPTVCPGCCKSQAKSAAQEHHIWLKPWGCCSTRFCEVVIYNKSLINSMKFSRSVKLRLYAWINRLIVYQSPQFSARALGPSSMHQTPDAKSTSKYVKIRQISPNLQIFFSKRSCRSGTGLVKSRQRHWELSTERNLTRWTPSLGVAIAWNRESGLYFIVLAENITKHTKHTKSIKIIAQAPQL